MDVPPAEVLRALQRRMNRKARLHHLESYGGRVRNPFAPTRKFSGKTASTRRQK
jgi:hypothetical protein